MKAIKVTKPFEISITEIEKPKITTCNDVIIKITSGGICGSDIQIYNGTNALATYPRIIGHEFGGVVTEIGSNVKNVKVGDKVAVNPVISCGKCYACSVGRSNVCSSLEVMGVHRDGGFCEYKKVPKENVHRFKEDFDKNLLSIVEPYTIGMQINNRGRITEGDKVVVLGCGPIGICVMEIAKSRNATVLMSDILPERIAKAKEMGADITVLSTKENLEEKILSFTNNEGAPVIVDTVCTPSTFEESVKYASPAGRVLVIGLKKDLSNIIMSEITKKELDIIGSRLSINCFDDVTAAFENNTLHPEKLKSSEFNFNDIQKAFDLIKEKPEEVLKVVINFENQ